MKSQLFYLLYGILFFAQTSFSQEITMFPGFWGIDYYEDSELISKGEVEALMSHYPETIQLWQKADNHFKMAWVAFGAEVGFLIWQLNRAKNNESQTVPVIGGLSSAIVVIGFALSSSSLRKKSILKYNENLEANATVNLGLTTNGLGLVYQF